MLSALVLVAQTLVAIPVLTTPIDGAPADLQQARIEPQPDGQTLFVVDVQSLAAAPLATVGIRLYVVTAAGVARQVIGSLQTVNVPPNGHAEVSRPLTNLQVEAGERVAVLTLVNDWKLDNASAHAALLRAIGR